MSIKLRDIFKNNKSFICIMIIFLIGSIVYGFNNVKKINFSSDKEIVNIVLPDSEITKGLKESVEKFNLDNEDIEINFESYEKDYINVAITKIVNSRDIDIFQYFDNFLIYKDEVENLDNLNIDYSKVDDESIVKFNENVIGVRYGEIIPKMVVNKEILEKAGITDFKGINTFNDLIEIATKIKENVQGVTPIGISTTDVDDTFMLFGTHSAMNNNVYSTFWNYEKGKFTFNEAEETLDVYRNLYSNGLINDDFNTKKSMDLFEDFTDGKIGITFAQSDNGIFLETDTEYMDIAIQEMPTFRNSELNKRYYHPSTKIMLIRNYDKPVDSLTNEKVKDMGSHKNAVKVVYEWLASEKVKNKVINNEFNSFSKNRGYDSSFENSEVKFEYGKLDPSMFISIDKNIIRDTFTDLIKGTGNMNSELIKLEEEISTRIKNSDDIEKINLSLYKEKE